MTREEIIICKEFLNDADNTHSCNEYKLLMQLLEQEPCEDCISRAQAQTGIELGASRYTLAKEHGTKGRVEWSDSLIKVSDAVDIIRNLPSVTPTTSWIPVSEKLPRKNEFVGNVAKHYLIQDEFGDMEVAAYTNRGWIPIHTIETFEYDVVAWMPLPKVYKVEKESEE